MGFVGSPWIIVFFSQACLRQENQGRAKALGVKTV